MSGSQGKIVAINGASGGIGEATALLLAERGAKIVRGGGFEQAFDDGAADLRQARPRWWC